MIFFAAVSNHFTEFFLFLTVLLVVELEEGRTFPHLTFCTSSSLFAALFIQLTTSSTDSLIGTGRDRSRRGPWSQQNTPFTSHFRKNRGTHHLEVFRKFPPGDDEFQQSESYWSATAPGQANSSSQQTTQPTDQSASVPRPRPSRSRRLQLLPLVTFRFRPLPPKSVLLFGARGDD